MNRYTTPRFLPLVLTGLALLLVAGAAAVAQSWAGKGRVRGSVRTEDGKAIEGAKIVLFLGSEGNGPDVILTDKKGRWEYLGLTSGDFTIRVSAEGYIPSEGVVNVAEYGSNRTPPIDMNLRSLQEIQDKEANRVGGLLDAANAKMQAGDWAGARAGFEEVKAAMNDPAQIRKIDAAIADTHLKDGQHDKARQILQSLLSTSEDPTEKSGFLQRIALTHYDQKDIDAAVSTLDQALAVQPDNVSSLRMIIDILVGEGRESDAEPYMDRLPAGEKVDANALLNVGIAAYNEGDVDTALAKFQKVLADYPENPNAHYYLGLCFLSQGANDKAREHLEKMLELAPDHEKAAEAKDFLSYL